MQRINRGDIFFVSKSHEPYGSEQSSNRPAIVVSNDKCNLHSNVVEVVYLTTKTKRNMPTHVRINSMARPSTALCEQIHSVDISRLQNYSATCTKAEMEQIDNAIAISVGIAEKKDLDSLLRRTEGERDAYKKMYFDLLERMINE